MENSIVIDDGYKTYDIKNKQGKLLCQFSFSPFDGGVVCRYKEVSKNLNNMALNLENQKLSNEEKYEKAEKYIKEQYNYLFNADVAGSFFTVLSPLTVLPDGKIFAEKVMEVIANVVNQETGIVLDKVKIRVGKYTNKYHV